MKKVCIALDYNPLAEKVAETGYAYAKALGAETTLVHVLTDASYYAIDYDPIMGFNGFLTESNLELGADIEQGAQNFLSATAQHLNNRNVKTAVLEGEAADAILDYAKEYKMDLIVMGTHGHSGLKHLLMGNTAARIVKHSQVPLLIVPTKK